MESLLLLLIIPFSNAATTDLHFPDNLPRPIVFRNDHISRNFTLLQRGSEEYDKFIENVIAHGVSKLTVSLDKLLLDFLSNGVDNVAFSPVSIAGALALILMGSNGKTFKELATVMGLSAEVDIEDKSQIVHEHLGKMFSKLDRSSLLGEKIKIATSIFVQNDFPIRTLYKQTSGYIYKSDVLNLDFKQDSRNAQRVINSWISDKTESKITSILHEPPPGSTRVIIVSALYFNGAWEKPFFQGFTRRRKFFPNGRKSVTNIEAEMMSNGGQFPYYKDTLLDCEIMGFPYKGNQTVMYVIMPAASNIQKLKELEKRLTYSDLDRLVTNTKYTQSVVLFPKMKLESAIDLTGALQIMGVKSLFNPAEANLAVLSSGYKEGYSAPLVQPTTPVPATRNLNSVLILNKFGFPENCTNIFDPTSNITKCQEVDEVTNKQVTYKKFGDKLGRRVSRQAIANSLDNLRNSLNRDPNNNNVENPGLYADKVLHKVYIDITETGTEAAAATSVSLSRGGDITTFRVDVPFLFFIRQEDTKLILFWGRVTTPTPSFS